MKKYLAKANQQMRAAALTEYTFIVTSRSISTQETISASTLAEAKKIIQDKYPDAQVEWVRDKRKN